MRNNMGYRQVWAGAREFYSPSFRAEIDRIVGGGGWLGEPSAMIDLLKGLTEIQAEAPLPVNKARP